MVGKRDGDGRIEISVDEVKASPNKETKESVRTKLTTYLLNSNHPSVKAKQSGLKKPLDLRKIILWYENQIQLILKRLL